MFRLTSDEGQIRTMLIIEGRLSRDYVELVETCCDQAAATGKAVHLFLRDVSAVDQAGRALLARLASKGVRLLASGVYGCYLVRTLSKPHPELGDVPAEWDQPVVMSRGEKRWFGQS